MDKTRNRYVAINNFGQYLTPRRNTGKMYENRSGWSDNIDDAKIFSTSGAAKNSSRVAGCDSPNIFAVEIKLVGEPI